MGSTLWGERFAAVSFIAFAVFMGNKAWSFPSGGGMFPLFTSAAIILIAVVMLVRTFVRPSAYRSLKDIRFSPDWIKPLFLTAVIILYVFAIFWIGYFVTTFLVLVIAPFAAGLRRPVFTLAAAFGATVFIYLLFQVALEAQMPHGLLF